MVNLGTGVLVRDSSSFNSARDWNWEEKQAGDEKFWECSREWELTVRGRGGDEEIVAGEEHNPESHTSQT